MNEDLLELFEDSSIYTDLVRPEAYHQLKGTDFTYVHRERKRWIHNDSDYVYVTFEYVLDNVPEDIQARLLFHLDYFLGEVKDG